MIPPSIPFHKLKRPLQFCAIMAVAALFNAQTPFEYFEMTRLEPPAIRYDTQKNNGPFFPDPYTRPPDRLELEEPFAPPVGIYKRGHVFSKFSPDSLSLIQDLPNHDACAPYSPKSVPESHSIHRSAAVFVHLEKDTFADLPSDSPSMAITRFRVTNSNGAPVSLQLFRCKNDSYAIYSEISGNYNITYKTVSPLDAARPKDAAFFHLAQPNPQQPHTPLHQNTINLLIQRVPALHALNKDKRIDALISWIQTFQSAALSNADDTSSPIDILSAIARQKKGVCRHRAILAMLMADAWGYHVRVVTNETHAFLEIYHNGSWHAVELGGMANTLTMRPTTNQNKPTGIRQADFSTPASPPHPSQQIENQTAKRQTPRQTNDAQRPPIDLPHAVFMPFSPLPHTITRGKTLRFHGWVTTENYLLIPNTRLEIRLQSDAGTHRYVFHTKTFPNGTVDIKLAIPETLPTDAASFSWFIVK